MMLEDRIKEKIGHNIASDDVVLFMNCLLYTSPSPRDA